MAERRVKAVHGLKKIARDPAREIELSRQLKSRYDRNGLLEIYALHVSGDTDYHQKMRRTVWRALAKKFGHGITIGPGVAFKHIETFEIGDGVFIGAQSYIQGRFDGVCRIGRSVWIGPQSFFDARQLIIEDRVGWGPGGKVLGSMHSGVPIGRPIIQTDLIIKPVRIGAESDIGVNAVILPGVTIGKGSIVGAGAVVTRNVQPYAIVTGVPARFLKWRDGYSS